MMPQTLTPSYWLSAWVTVTICSGWMESDGSISPAACPKSEVLFGIGHTETEILLFTHSGHKKDWIWMLNYIKLNHTSLQHASKLSLMSSYKVTHFLKTSCMRLWSIFSVLSSTGVFVAVAIWVKSIDFYFMPKLIRRLCKDNVQLRYFVNFLL